MSFWVLSNFKTSREFKRVMFYVSVVLILLKLIYFREDLKIQLLRLAVFGKPQFTIVNEDFTKTA